MTDSHTATRDSARPEAVAKRHALGKRTARENIADLCDGDSFMEYGALTIAAQRNRRALDDLFKVVVHGCGPPSCSKAADFDERPIFKYSSAHALG